MSTPAPPISFAGTSLGAYRHVCAFFNTPDEEYRTLLPFIRDGLLQGERAYHVIDPSLREKHLQHLREAGIDVEAAQRTGQLEVEIPQNTYLRGGHFDKDAMLELIQEALRAGVARGFPLTRLVAHCECGVGDWPGGRDWVEYEARLNYVLPRYQDPVICTYDCRMLGAGVALDILRTHPMVILGEVLHENPFYVPPDEFLRELGARRPKPEPPAAP